MAVVGEALFLLDKRELGFCILYLYILMECRSYLIGKRELEPDSIAGFFVDIRYFETPHRPPRQFEIGSILLK